MTENKKSPRIGIFVYQLKTRNEWRVSIGLPYSLDGKLPCYQVENNGQTIEIKFSNTIYEKPHIDIVYDDTKTN